MDDYLRIVTLVLIVLVLVGAVWFAFSRPEMSAKLT